MRKAYAYYFYFVFVLTFLLLYPLFRYYLAKESRYPKANNLRRFWAKWIFLLMGYRHEIKREGNVLPGQHYVYCSNHSSNLDIMLSALCVPETFSFLAKKQWAEMPVFGIFFRTVDFSVDRASKVDAHQAFEEAKVRIEKNVNLIIYPEGKMYSQGPSTKAFKNGPFRLAIDMQVPVVPMTFLDNWRLYPVNGSRGAQPGKLRAIVHEPISTKGMTRDDEDDLRQHVKAIIDDHLKAAYSQEDS